MPPRRVTAVLLVIAGLASTAGNNSRQNASHKIHSQPTSEALPANLRQLPPAQRAVDRPPYTGAGFKTEFPRFLDFLLPFCPEGPGEKALRTKFAGIVGMPKGVLRRRDA